jgi:hypothetical protein
LQPTLGLTIERLPGFQRGPAQPEITKLDIRAQGAFTQQLGKTASGSFAVKVHLEQAVSGMDVTLNEGDIEWVITFDCGNPILILSHHYRATESREIKIFSPGRLKGDG